MWHGRGFLRAPVPVRKRRRVRRARVRIDRDGPSRTGHFFPSIFFSLPYFSRAVRADSGFWGTPPRSNYRVRECDVDPSRNFIHAHDKRISGEELGYPCLGSAFPRRARWAFVGDRNTGPGPGPRTFGDRRVWAAAGAAWFVTRREGCHNSYLERRRQQRRFYFSSFLVSGTV